MWDVTRPFIHSFIHSFIPLYTTYVLTLFWAVNLYFEWKALLNIRCSFGGSGPWNRAYRLSFNHRSKKGSLKKMCVCFHNSCKCLNQLWHPFNKSVNELFCINLVWLVIDYTRKRLLVVLLLFSLTASSRCIRSCSILRTHGLSLTQDVSRYWSTMSFYLCFVSLLAPRHGASSVWGFRRRPPVMEGSCGRVQ
jgi:hypothetical protein